MTTRPATTVHAAALRATVAAAQVSAALVASDHPGPGRLAAAAAAALAAAIEHCHALAEVDGITNTAPLAPAEWFDALDALRDLQEAAADVEALRTPGRAR